MGELIAYIGRDRNKIIKSLETNPMKTYVLNYPVKHDVVDLRVNLKSFLEALHIAYLAGWRDISVKNIEIGLEIGLFVYLEKIKIHYPDLIFRYTTTIPQACWPADKLFYFGEKEYIKNDEDDVYLNRVKFGNVLDAYGSGLLSEPYENLEISYE